jgi:hypothetical protein
MFSLGRKSKVQAVSARTYGKKEQSTIPTAELLAKASAGIQSAKASVARMR